MTFPSLGFVGGVTGGGTVINVIAEAPLTVVMPVPDCRPSCARTSHEIPLFRGDSLAQPVQVLEGTVPLDLTGATLRFSVRRTEGSTPVLIEKEPVITSAIDGEFTILLDPEDTDSLDGNIKYWYDVEMTLAGVVRTLVKDRLYLKQDISWPEEV